MKKALLLLALATFSAGLRADDNRVNLALAREVIAAQKMDRMLDGMVGQLKQFALQSSPLPADATEAQKAKFAAFQDKVIDLSMAATKDMLTQMDQVFAEIYTEAELRAMLAFFNSPEGQSMLAKQPAAMAKIMPLAQKLQQELLPKIQALVAETQAADATATPAVPAGQ